LTDGVIYLNGTATAAHDPGMRLLDWLRDDAGETGPKEGCAAGHCGACNVLVDGRPAPSCCLLVHAVVGRDVWTSAGLATTATGRKVHEKFGEHGAIQCGFCGPGMTVSAIAWLTHRVGGAASRTEAAGALAGNVCRCGGYAQLIDALLAAALDTQAVAP
jgi:aerobic-type carbon monoxide dehydrogenase small subunit (CoxS/CutS family)